MTDNHTCSLSRPLLLALQVWVRQTVVENDLNLFKELPTHLRAQVAWRSNKSIMDKLDTFQVCCQKCGVLIGTMQTLSCVSAPYLTSIQILGTGAVHPVFKGMSIALQQHERS